MLMNFGSLEMKKKHLEEHEMQIIPSVTAFIRCKCGAVMTTKWTGYHSGGFTLIMALRTEGVIFEVQECVSCSKIEGIDD